MLVAVLALLGMNGLAFMHARAFTHYGDPDADEYDVEDLSFGDKAKLLFTGVPQPRPKVRRKPAFWTWYRVHTFESADGVKLEAWHIPRKEAKGVVALFHGYGTSKSSVLEEANGFRALGYSVFLVDFRGSGNSSGSVTTLGVREAEDVAAAVKCLRGLEPDLPLILYGSSMGAAAVLRAVAREGVKPAAAVLECPFDSMLSTVKNRFRMMHAPSFPAAQLLVFWGGVQHGFNGFAHNPVDYAKEVECPVLLIGGAKDRRVTQAQLRSVHDALAGPKQLEIFEELGHGGYAKNESRRWRRIVGAFLDKHLAEPEPEGEPVTAGAA